MHTIKTRYIIPANKLPISTKMFPNTLIHRLIQLAPKNTLWHTPIEGLYLYCCDRPTELQSYTQEPSICIVLQGERVICVGEQCHRFLQDKLMFCPVNLPVTMIVPEASAAQPYLSISLKIDTQRVQQVLHQLPDGWVKKAENMTAWTAWELEQTISSVFTRLLGLLDTPQDIAFLSPLIQQELYYRLLHSELGGRLKSLVEHGSHTQTIVQAGNWIEQHLNEAFVVEQLAAENGMSVSGFHHHFKRLTGMSPLQYQKQLRLNEAHRLIQSEHYSVSQAAFTVGYESPSQFSREYKRKFGKSPSHHARPV
ncbi:TPA: AraC family transcriptional regulator N-terminal domain-containing protein [Mannheimia haemolytica]